jgi:hypothetical protein
MNLFLHLLFVVSCTWAMNSIYRSSHAQTHMQTPYRANKSQTEKLQCTNEIYATVLKPSLFSSKRFKKPFETKTTQVSIRHDNSSRSSTIAHANLSLVRTLIIKKNDIPDALCTFQYPNDTNKNQSTLTSSICSYSPNVFSSTAFDQTTTCSRSMLQFENSLNGSEIWMSCGHPWCANLDAYADIVAILFFYLSLFFGFWPSMK